MTDESWQWVLARPDAHRKDRTALIREIPFEISALAPLDPVPAPRQEFPGSQGMKALSLNLSQGGMLLLMTYIPSVDQVLRLQIPTMSGPTHVPTLAEVRWVRAVPLPSSIGVNFVGVKFLL